jgi:hypothetical protein
MVTMPITQDTDCSECAGENILPALDFAYLEMPPEEDRDSYFDLGKMEDAINSYKAEETKVIVAHRETVEIFRIWANRTDSVYAKTVVIQDTIGGFLGEAPTENFEEFELFDRSITYGAVLTALTSLYGIYSARQAVLALADDAVRWTRFKAKGGLVLTVLSTALSITILFINEKRRSDALIQAIPEYQAWLYGRAEDTGKIIEKPTAETALGSVGQVNGMQGAVAQMIQRITDLAEVLGIEVERDGKPVDPEIIYCELEKTLIGSIKTAAEIEASFAIATRMICLDNSDATVDFSDQEISKATGLSDTLVARRRNDVAADPSLCET